MKSALFVWGGWEGHTPEQCVDLFAPWLADQEFQVEVSDTLDTFAHADKLKTLALIVPVWTMGTLSDQQEEGLCDAVAARSGSG